MALTASNEYTRLMVEMFDERKKRKAPTAFMASFFGVPGTGAVDVFSNDTKTVEIDIIRGNKRRLASLVNRGAMSDDTTRSAKITSGKFTNIVRAWPLIESTGGINSNELLDRVAGETPFQLTTRRDRLIKKAIDINMEMADNQIRTMEFLCRESVLTGSHPMILGTSNTNLIYDFFRKSTHTFAASAAWDIVGTDIIGDLDTMADLILLDSFNSVNDVGILVGASAFEGMRKNTQIKAEADIRHFGSAEINTRFPEPPREFDRYRENGFSLVGRLTTYKARNVWIYVYDQTFTDDFSTVGTDTETPWMPIAKALMFVPSARCDRYFGPPDRLPVEPSEIQMYQEAFGLNMSSPVAPNVQNTGVIDARAFHFDAYKSADKKVFELRLQSAAIFPTTETDAFVTITGLTT